jgi:hypothetical protein
LLTIAKSLLLASSFFFFLSTALPLLTKGKERLHCFLVSEPTNRASLHR